MCGDDGEKHASKCANALRAKRETDRRASVNAYGIGANNKMRASMQCTRKENGNLARKASMPVIARMWGVLNGKLRASMQAQLRWKKKNNDKRANVQMLTVLGQISKCEQVCSALGRKW